MSALKDSSTVTSMKSLIGKWFSYHVIELLNSVSPRAGYIAKDVGRGDRANRGSHMGVHYFHIVSKLD